MKIEKYNLAGEKISLINWLQGQINDFNNVRQKEIVRVHFELSGYTGEDNILPEEIREEIYKLADKVKGFYVTQKERLEKEVDAL